MKSVRILAAALLPLLLAAVGATDFAWAEEAAQQNAESPERKIARLERIIADQDDLIALLMENLANCTEENESLAGRQAKGGENEEYVGGEKIKLMEKIRAALHTEENPGFLNALTEAQLASLLGLIEEIPKRTGSIGADGDGKTQVEHREPGIGRGAEQAPN